MKLRTRILLGGLLGVCIAGPDRGVRAQLGVNGAGPIPTTVFASGAPASPPFTLPPEPAVPAGCIKPSLAQCADGAWYRSDVCLKDAAKAGPMKAYCTWQLQRAWNTAPSQAHKGFNPGSAPTEVYPILAPGKPVDRSKSLPTSTNLPASYRSKAATRSGYTKAGTPTPAVPANPPAASFVTPSAAKGSASGAFGTYSSLSASKVVTGAAVLERDFGAAMRAGNTLTAQQQSAFGTAMLVNPSYVTPGAKVTSCEDYAWKRWGDYSKFSFAAKQMGRKGRQIYNLAMDPQSPLYINKTLNQLTYGSGPTTAIPKQIPDALKKNQPAPFWPANAFITIKPDWLSKPSAITKNNKALITPAEIAQVNALIDAQWRPAAGSGVARRPRKAVATDPSPLGLFRDLKQNLDQRYGNPTDDELRDARKRSSAYQDLYSLRSTIEAEYHCASANDPCFVCNPRPGQGLSNSIPAVFQKIRDRVSGAPVINPADVVSIYNAQDVTSLWSGHSTASRYQGLANLSLIGDAMAGLEVPANVAGAAMGGAKQKGAPTTFSQVAGGTVPKAPTGGAGGGALGAGSSQCMLDLTSKRGPLGDALTKTERQLTSLLQNELRFNQRGCLSNPGSGIANLCDWNYDDFAAVVPTLLDGNVEADHRQCTFEIARGNRANPMPTVGSNSAIFENILRNVGMQPLIFPCTQRRDFTVNAVEVSKFVDLNDGEGLYCENGLQNLVIAGQQAAVASQLEGLPWVPGERKLADSEVDELSLGDKDYLAAYYSYDTSWELKGAKKAGGTEMDTCKFEGAARQVAKAGIDFFGTRMELIKLSGSGTAKAGGGTVSMAFSYVDIDGLNTSMVSPPNLNKSNVPVGPGVPFVRPLVTPPIVLGSASYGWWFAIGPVPLHIEFGAAAEAGIEYRFGSSAGDNCSNMNGASGFEVSSRVVPYAKASAYADASVDVLVASAGVRLELDLLNLELPIGVSIRNKSDTVGGWQIENGGTIGIDMLDGRLSAYAEVGVSPLEVSYEATVLSWNGFHTEVPIFGLSKTLSQNAMRIALAGQVTPANTTCSNACSNIKCLTCGSNAGLCAGCTDARPAAVGGYYCRFPQSAINQLSAQGNSACQKYLK